MTVRRRCLLALSVLLSTSLVLDAPVAADDRPGGDANAAIAVNQQDGATVVRTAMSIRKVSNGVVDQTNEAYALASCVDCTTVAVALQVVLVRGEAHTVTPVNRAIAVNDQCTQCLTYASATQIVLGVDGPVRFTAGGRQRLAALDKSLRELEERISSMNAAELHAAVTAAKAELVSVLETELIVKTGDQDRAEPEDPFTTVAPESETTPSPTAQGTSSTAPSSTTPVSGPVVNGSATSSTASP